MQKKKLFFPLSSFLFKSLLYIVLMLLAELRLELFVVVFGFDEVVFEAFQCGEADGAEYRGDYAHVCALLLEGEGEGDDINYIGDVDEFVLETLGGDEVLLLFFEIVLGFEDAGGIIISMITVPNRKSRPKHTDVFHSHHDVWIVYQDVGVQYVAHYPYNDERERERNEPRPMYLFLLREPLFKIVHQAVNK